MDFVKAEGLGNDFIVVPEPLRATPDRIAAWCEPKTGIGADGVLEITPVNESSVAMRYWNADGGAAEMCGNGLRCVALIAVELGLVAGPTLTVHSAVGEHPATVLPGGIVRAFVGEPHAFGPKSSRLPATEFDLSAWAIRMRCSSSTTCRWLRLQLSVPRSNGIPSSQKEPMSSLWSSRKAIESQSVCGNVGSAKRWLRGPVRPPRRSPLANCRRARRRRHCCVARRRVADRV